MKSSSHSSLQVYTRGLCVKEVKHPQLFSDQKDHFIVWIDCALPSFVLYLFHPLSKKNSLYTDDYGTFLEMEEYEFKHT